MSYFIWGEQFFHVWNMLLLEPEEAYQQLCFLLHGGGVEISEAIIYPLLSVYWHVPDHWTPKYWYDKPLDLLTLWNRNTSNIPVTLAFPIWFAWCHQYKVLVKCLLWCPDDSGLFRLYYNRGWGLNTALGQDINLYSCWFKGNNLFLILFCLWKEWKRNAFARPMAISCTWAKVTNFSNSTTSDTTSATEPVIWLHLW